MESQKGKNPGPKAAGKTKESNAQKP